MAANPPSVEAPNIGKGLSHKLGPLPVWGWVVVGGVIIGVGYLAYSAYQSAQGNNVATPSLSDLGALLGGSGTPAGTATTTTTTTTPVTPLTASQFINTNAATIAAQTGETTAQVSLYLNDLFSGLQPVGVPGATTAFGNVVQAAQGIAGYPSQLVPLANLNANPYTSNQAYLSSLLTYLPSGTSQSVINEISNLYNGTTTVISQDAANALAAGQSVVGIGPTPVNYTLSGLAGLTSGAIDTWNNAYLSLTTSNQTFANWIANAPPAITSAVDTGTLNTIYSYFYTSAGKAAVAAAGGSYGWWQKYLANPSGTPITAPPTSGGGTTTITGGTTGH